MNTRILLRLVLAIFALTPLLIVVFAQRQAKRPTATKPATTEQRTHSSRPAFTNSIGMQFVQIPAGTFWMGSDSSHCPRDDPFTERNEYQDCARWIHDDQKPRHQVTISQSFWLGKYEVTQVEWYKVMGNNPSAFKRETVGGDPRNHPVDSVSWEDAQQFINKLNEMDSANRYRLPTEAEWEYAARAGTTGDYAGNLDAMAWYKANSKKKPDDFMTEQPHAVGTKQPNAWGLYDMHGNVCEWVHDWYDKSYYSNSPTTDPLNPGTSPEPYRVLRGGSWGSDAVSCRAAHRLRNPPSARLDFLGVRLVRLPR